MIPVKYDETQNAGAGAWVITTADNSDWYDYDTKANKWANVMLMDNLKVTTANGEANKTGYSDNTKLTNEQIKALQNNGGTKRTPEEVAELLEGAVVSNTNSEMGSMFVWIPRYEYKITDPKEQEEAGTIDVNFISTEVKSGIAGYETTNGITKSSDNYIIHPAFTDDKTNNYDNGGWDKELPGIWVAKFEASNPSKTATSNSIDKIRVIPNVQSWKGIQIGNMYTVCRNMTGSSASTYGFKEDKEQAGTGENYAHLMKNSEWGAVAYLAHSKYGRNGNEIDINTNSSYITGIGGDTTTGTTSQSGDNYKYNGILGVKASTTGNVYGIYDMSGGSYEYVAAYISNGHSNLGYGEFFTNYQDDESNYQKSSTKYATVYPYDSSKSDTAENNYNLYTGYDTGYGDAIKETSKSGKGRTSWFSDYSYFPHFEGAFFMRGGRFDTGSAAGLFYFYRAYGSNSSDIGFRPVLVSF